MAPVENSLVRRTRIRALSTDRKPRSLSASTSKARSSSAPGTEKEKDAYKGNSAFRVNKKKPTLKERIENISPFGAAMLASTIREFHKQQRYGDRADTWTGWFQNLRESPPAHREHSLEIITAFKRDPDAADATIIPKEIDRTIRQRQLTQKEGKQQLAEQADTEIVDFRIAHAKELTLDGYTQKGDAISKEAIEMTQKLESDPRYQRAMKTYQGKQDKKWWDAHPVLSLPWTVPGKMSSK